MATEKPHDQMVDENETAGDETEAVDAPEEPVAEVEESVAEPEDPAADAETDLSGEAASEDGETRADDTEAPDQAEAPENGDQEKAVDGEDAKSEAEGDSETEELLKPPPDDGIKRRWYALHAYSGQEANVKRNILVHAEQEGLADLFAGVLVPMEEVAEIKSGEKKISKRKFFPGYVLVRLPEHPERYPELWHMIKETPGVSGFIGSRTAPVPLEDAEVQAIVEEMRGERERPKPKVKFEQGERVKIIDGPFSNFLGNIDDINAERGTLRVMVEIFERLTSVEVEFWQVEKM